MLCNCEAARILYVLTKKYMHNIKTNFDKVSEIIKKMLREHLNESGNIQRVGKKPKFSDASVISLAITSEAMSIDSENFLFKKLKSNYSNDFPNLIDRSQYNVRRRKLKEYIDKVREGIVRETEQFEDVFSLDSMPVEVCKLSRSKRCKTARNTFETAPSKGFCASQQMYYYGYKLHCVCSYRGFIHSYDLTKANVHDIAYLDEVKQQFNNCLMLGDKGYLSAEIKLDLFTSANIQLETPMRINQNNYKPQPYIFKKVRKRVETIFSQLCDQFMIRRNYAKTAQGIFTRVVSKITAMAVLQYINILNNKPCGHLKHALF
jgi:hypothetical protein